MNQSPKNPATSTNAPLQSPYPALQALLPRLSTLRMRGLDPPVFHERRKAIAHLDEKGMKDEFYVVPVWEIDHRDLTSSEVVTWSFARWLN